MINRDETLEELITRVYNYALDIVEGRIIAGQPHIWSCQRFLKDIEQIESEEYPFYFDSDELYRFYKWSRLFTYFDGIYTGQALMLPDFHLFICANILCWKHKTTGYRKYKKAYIQTARKNWKTGIVAMLSSYLGFNSDGKAEIYIAGWVKDQSNAGFNQLKTYFANCKFLKGKYTDSYGKITHIKSESYIQPLSKEARKTGDSKNPDVFIVDEYHNHETTEIYDTGWSGMKLKPNRLLIAITTAGFNMNFPCFREYEYAKRIVNPNDTTINETYFVMICELDEEDNIKDESVWPKVSPLVTSFPEGIQAIRDDLQEALDNPDKMRTFLTKTMNIWINKHENGYMDLEKWKKCENHNLRLADFAGEEGTVGMDLSADIDLTSTSVEFKKLVDGKPKYIIFTHSFIPQGKLEERIKTDKQPFDLWVRQGWITAIPGDVIDYDYIKKWIHDLTDVYGIKVEEVCSDPWNALSVFNDLRKEGFKDEQLIEVPQTMKVLSGPTKDLRKEIYSGNVEHDGNPCTTWAMGNAVTIIDTKENIMLDKSKSTDRIDPVAAIVDSHTRMMNRKVKNKISEAIKEGRFRFV
jgi:phage terminase large subunit-like protein